MVPILLDLRGRTCLVVGGGPVGRRKATTVFEAGAVVQLVCLEPPPPDVPERMTWMTEAYRVGHLDGVSLVFAAATSEVNAQVVVDARSRNIWVNSASDPEAGDVALPAVGGRGRIRVTVDTGGASPVIAAYIRNTFEEQ